MNTAGRSVLAAVAWLLSVAALHAQAQAPPPAETAARSLLASIRAGEEDGAPCDRFDPSTAKALLLVADQSRGEPLPRLISAYRLAERAGRCTGTDDVVGPALNALSNTLLDNGAFDQALETGRRSVAFHEQRGDAVGLAEAWNRVGSAQWWKNDTQACLAAYHKALDLSTEAGDRVGQARAWNNIATVQKNLGELDAALEYLGKARDVFDTLGDHARMAVVVNNMATVYFIRGEYRTALECNGRAVSLNREVGSMPRLAASLDTRGNVYRALGSYRQALQSFNEALDIRKRVGVDNGAMETIHNIGLVHFSQGDYELAIDAFKQGLRLNRVLRERWFTAEALRNIGAAAWRLGQRERAAANFRESLAIAREQGLRIHEGEVLHDLAQMALAGKRPAEAWRLLNASLDLRTRMSDLVGVSETLTTMATARLQERRYDEVLVLARRAADNAQAYDQTEQAWQPLTLLGIAYRRLGRADEAREALEQSIASIEQLSSRTTGGDTLRQRFFEDKLSPYHELMALRFEQRAYADALELAERSKARVLSELVLRAHSEENTILDAEEKRERARLHDALVSRNQQVEAEESRSPRDEGRLRAALAARGAARQALAAYETALFARHPELARVHGNVQPLSPRDLVPLVRPGTAAIEYAVADDRLFAFVVTNDGGLIGVEGRSIRIDAAALAASCASLQRRIASRDLAFAGLARRMYELLLGPLRDRLAGRSRVVVVPDGPLWSVPFQALQGPDGYFVETASVSYAPSLTVLSAMQKLPKPNGTARVLAIGKSSFGGGAGKGLEDLPEAEAQARAIRDLYGPERAAVLVGDEATKAQVQEAAPHYAIIHVATHAVLEEGNPLYSYLVLTPASGKANDDGRLEAWELMRMKLQAELVVLAACDTAGGRIASGEGVIGTMWALFAAGARAIVVSQYPVESKSAAALTLGLHRRLARGTGGQALHLREAALELLRTPRYAHPYYWAGFILVGDVE